MTVYLTLPYILTNIDSIFDEDLRLIVPYSKVKAIISKSNTQVLFAFSFCIEIFKCFMPEIT